MSLNSRLEALVARIGSVIRGKADLNAETEGIVITSYGHSYTMVPSPYTTPNGGEYPLRLGKRLKASRVDAFGRSGTPAPDTFAMALGTNPSPDKVRTFQPGTPGLVLIHNYMNEASSSGYGATSAFQEYWKGCIRSLMALVSAGSIISNDQLTWAGAWTDFANPTIAPFFRDGKVKFSSTIGATASFTTTSDTIWVVGISATGTYRSGDIRVRRNGSPVATIGTEVKPEYTSILNPALAGYMPFAYPVTGLGTASKTITLEVSQAINTWINCVLIPSPAPPAIVLVKESRRGPQATSGGAAFDANDPAYRQAIDELVTEFPNAYSVDFQPGYDLGTMVASRDTVHNFHPNDLGMMHYTNALEDIMPEVIAGSLDGVMVL